MGKKLIIKGADFSENCIVETLVLKNYVRTTQLGQYVQIDFADTLNCDSTKIEAIFKYGDASRDYVLIGQSSGYCEIRSGSHYSLGVTYGKNSESVSNTVNQTITKDVDTTTVQEPTKITINGVETAISISYGGMTYLKIFKEDAEQYGNVAIKRIKIYNTANNALLYDLVPALYQNVPCLYDAVSETAYYANSGSLAVANV